MTSVVLSPPPGPSSSPSSSSSKNVLMSVAVETTTKKSPLTETDSPTTTAIDVGLGQMEDMEPEEEDDDENDVQIANGFLDATTEQRPTKKRRRVSFECADIVEFEPTVYTTSITSGGVPVGLSLNERSRSRRRLDSYEMERENERVGRQNYMEEGYLDPQEREIILNNAGCEEPVIASVEAEVNTIIQLRRESNEIDFDFMYGHSELGDQEESIEEEEEDASNAVPFEEDGVREQVQEESDEEKVPSVSTSEEASVEEPVSSVHPNSDDVPEAASI